MENTTTTISTSSKRRTTSKGLAFTKMIVTKIPEGKRKNGKQAYRSVTSHVVVG